MVIGVNHGDSLTKCLSLGITTSSRDMQLDEITFSNMLPTRPAGIEQGSYIALRQR